MKFTVVKEVPNRTVKKHLYSILDEVLTMNAKFVKVEFDKNEYKHVGSAQSNLCDAAKRYGFPMRVSVINGELYIIRKDI